MNRNEAIDILRVIAPPRTNKKAFYDFMEARDMAIAALEAYVPDTNVGKWNLVSEGLPEEKINPNTHDFEEVLCSTTFGDVRAYKFGTPFGWEKPHFWHGGGMMDEYVKAWMPKPEPWKGKQHG